MYQKNDIVLVLSDCTADNTPLYELIAGLDRKSPMVGYVKGHEIDQHGGILQVNHVKLCNTGRAFNFRDDQLVRLVREDCYQAGFNIDVAEYQQEER
jgi:hypothetical protein